MLQLAVHTVTARLYRVKGPCSNMNVSSHIYFQKSTKFARARRLRVFEHRVLRRIFGPKRDEVIGEWKTA
jgi:hypothetical protein